MITCPKCQCTEFETTDFVRVLLQIKNGQCIWSEAHHFDGKPQCECQTCGHLMEIDLSQVNQEEDDRIARTFGPADATKSFEFTLKAVGTGSTESEAWDDVKDYLDQMVDQNTYTSAEEIS